MHKHKTVQSLKAADLVIHGTFDLRRALDQCAHPVWHPVLPASWPEPLQAREEVPTVIRARPRLGSPNGGAMPATPMG